MVTQAQSEELAAENGLMYVFDDTPGLRRLRRGRGFTYVDARGDSVGEETRDWILSLAIPPAWTDVWICPHRHGHILATGKDQAGRKQYIYHPLWAAAAEDVKFERMTAFGRHLPRLRRQIDADLRKPGLDRDKVIALSVAVLDRTLIRPGNRRYAEQNQSYGLTTLDNGHAEVVGNLVSFEFCGKGGTEQRLALRDRRLARLISLCQDVPGETLFSYPANGGIQSVTSADLNHYIAGTTRSRFTAKDFRTWGASSTVVDTLAATDTPLLAAIDAAAERLGNTRAVCRASYVHPLIAEAHADGRLALAWQGSRSGRWMSRAESAFRRLLDSE